MGPCFSQKVLLDANTPGEFHRDFLIRQNIHKPLTTTLYNILRKPKQLQIIRQNSGKPILKGQTNPDLTKIKTNDLKMLYNFKNLLSIESIPKALQALKQTVNLKNIYQISVRQAQTFANQYIIFKDSKGRQIKTSFIPLLVFHTDELVSLGAHSEKQIFIHAKKFKNQQVYELLHIKDIIEDGNDPKTGKPTDVVKKLLSSEGKKVLFLHSDKLDQNGILNILAEFVHQKYSTSMIQSKLYLRRFLPQINLADQLDKMVAQSMVDAGKQRQKEEQDSPEAKFQKHFKKLSSESGKDKTQRAYNLLVTLISNIYSNKQSENYRKVRKSNKQINEVLGKYKYGIKLLQMVGFLDEQGFYVNNMEGKYLKLYRTDLDLGYRKYCEKI